MVFVVAVVRSACIGHERHGRVGELPLGAGANFSHRHSDQGKLLVLREVLF